MFGTPQHPTLWLSPMEGVTDPPFRHICKGYGVDVSVTEFISSEALVRSARKSFDKMAFDPSDAPTAIQIFGHDEKSLCEAAELAAARKPAFVDINWGCPVRKVVSKGAGAGILRDIPRMVSVTAAVVRHLEPLGMPVTVKTRLGWDFSDLPIVDAAERLQDVGIACIGIHGRTRSQLYAGAADYTLIKAVKDNPRMRIPVIANGDIDAGPKAKEVLAYTGADGLLVGRAAIGNPWIFSQIKHYLATGTELPLPDLSTRQAACLAHFAALVEHYGPAVGGQLIKIHYSGYFKGLSGFKPFKARLMQTGDYGEAAAILEEYVKSA
ncbi:MAG: tRNA-dihydrouridine synthase [Bacteroidales bacterium]|nr:tRNA-dihydrouridine synthase [Bacteroidales bacterium]